MNPITFPGLELTFHIQRVAFQIFGKDIYWYGIIIAAGFLLAAAFCSWRAKDFGIKKDDFLDMLLWGLPIGIICARIYYVIFYLSLYRDAQGKFQWSEAIAIWDGGLAIYGGVIGGILTCLVAVSYTHLDVYKRQGADRPGHRPLRRLAHLVPGATSGGARPETAAQLGCCRALRSVRGSGLHPGALPDPQAGDAGAELDGTSLGDEPHRHLQRPH